MTYSVSFHRKYEAYIQKQGSYTEKFRDNRVLKYK